MVGEPLTTCTHLGIWSYSAPSCLTACGYPGSPLHGHISPVKFVYQVGELVRVQCDTGYILASSHQLPKSRCLDSPIGEWAPIEPMSAPAG